MSEEQSDAVDVAARARPDATLRELVQFASELIWAWRDRDASWWTRWCATREDRRRWMADHARALTEATP